MNQAKLMILEHNGVRVNIMNKDVQKKIWSFITQLKKEVSDFPNTHKQWTQEDDLTLATMIRNGASPKDLEEALLRSTKSIQIRAYHLGLNQSTGRGISNKNISENAVINEVVNDQPLEEIDL